MLNVQQERDLGDIIAAHRFGARVHPRAFVEAYDLGTLAGAVQGRERVIAVVDVAFANSPPGRKAQICEMLRAAKSEAEIKFVANNFTSEERELVRIEMLKLEAEARELEGKVAESERQIAYLRKCAAAADELEPWATTPWRLGRVSDSLFHKIDESPILVAWVDDHEVPQEIIAAQEQGAVFLVQHDWAGLLAQAHTDDGEVRLPFQFNCFEFLVSGRRVCYIVACDDGVPARKYALVRTSHGWVLCHGDDLLNGVLWAHVRAIAITLDAEVVGADVTRAPYRLNRERAEKGRRPLYDYHLLSLTRRPRLADPLPRDPGDGPTHRKRLHFRRGHWRHFQNHKTWIKWMLVGDASLGFADKDYTL